MGCPRLTYHEETERPNFLGVWKKGDALEKSTDYHIWGDVMREQKWEDLEVKYRYGYQGKYAEKDDETGWNHFELREYDNLIGRWTTKDPKGQYHSPYVGMGNNPVSGTDPDGGYSYFGALWRRLAYGGSGVMNRNLEGRGRTWGYIDKDGIEQYGPQKRGSFLSEINPVKRADVYVGGVAKTEVNLGGGVKAVVPFGGAQLAYNSNDGASADFVTAEHSYLNYQKGKVDIRIIPFNGINTGDYDPGVRLLYKASGGVIAVPIGEVPVPVGEWKTQGDVLLNPLTSRYQFGARGVLESYSFPSMKKGDSGFRFELNGGVRLQFKVPNIFK